LVLRDYSIGINAETDEMIAWRREIHKNPELSGCEYRTSNLIKNMLSEWDVKVQEFEEHFGVIGILEGQPGPCVAIRADMDALPVTEENEKPYKSINQGVMHACGHDAHVAVLLGCAKELSKRRGLIKGSVKFIFQPSEEDSPEGGARMMIRDANLKFPEVGMIFGLHVWPDLPTGTIGLRVGPMMASSVRFQVKIIGRGGHASQPHYGVDAVAMAISSISEIYQTINRKIDPMIPWTINIGKINGGERYNVIPKEVVFEGAVRAFDVKIQEQIEKIIRDVLMSITRIHGGEYNLKYNYGYPVLKNHKEPTDIVSEVGKEILGNENVFSEIAPVLASEDFSRYLECIPGSFFLLGCSSSSNGLSSKLHNSNFHLDEKSLLLGRDVLINVALRALETLST